MATIKLTQGYEAIIDDEDYVRVSQHKWYVMVRRGRPYAARATRVNGKKGQMHLSHFVLPNADGPLFFQDRNSLNCRKSNLSTEMPDALIEEFAARMPRRDKPRPKLASDHLDGLREKLIHLKKRRKKKQ